MANFGKLNFSTSFNPTSGFPLDARYYFDSYEAASAAAATAQAVGSSDSVYFYGENVVVIENNDATLYLIKPDKTLKAVGTVPMGDDLSIVIKDGKIQLHGFNEYYYKYEEYQENGETKHRYVRTEGFIAGLQPQVSFTEGGKYIIEWFQPNPTTVEGLSSQITSLSETVGNLETLTTNQGTQIGTLESNYNTLNTNLTDNYYTKTATDSKISEEIAKVNHLQYKKVNSLSEIDPSVAGADKYIYLVPRTNAVTENLYDEYMVLDGKVEKVGDWEVNLADYVTDNDLQTTLGNYYTKTETNNKIDDKVGTALGDYVTSTDLTTKLNTKVDKADGKSLIDDTLITKVQNSLEIDSVDTNVFAVSAAHQLGLNDTYKTKIDGIEAGAQVNKINSVSSDFAISETKELSLNNIEISKVTGLQDTLNLKANTSDIPETVLDAVKINGTALTIAPQDKSVNIPLANAATLGVVKGVNAEDTAVVGKGKVAVESDGSMTVVDLNVNKLHQDEADVLILDCGNAG